MVTLLAKPLSSKAKSGSICALQCVWAAWEAVGGSWGLASAPGLH